VAPKLGAAEVLGDAKICKVSIVGIGMRSHVGVASRMFRCLSEEGINIQMISTSEIKTSVVIDEKYMELAVRALHREFDLDQPADTSEATLSAASGAPRLDNRELRSRDRVAEGAPLLREYADVKAHRGFESLRLRHTSAPRPARRARPDRRRRS
jgi:hypothetical protein